jgi:2-iminobutanoate/2-iminopropanoate deaminase
MENAKKVLEASGSSMDKVFKTAIMLVNISDVLKVNEVYKSYFKEGHYPARSAYGVKELAMGALVEIEFIALVD